MKKQKAFPDSTTFIISLAQIGDYAIVARRIVEGESLRFVAGVLWLVERR